MCIHTYIHMDIHTYIHTYVYYEFEFKLKKSTTYIDDVYTVYIYTVVYTCGALS